MQENLPPVLMIHGLIGHMRGERLDAAIGPPLLAPDLPGYGARAASFESAGLQSQIGFLRSFLQSAAPGRRAVLVGHSIGGVIAILFALRYPDVVASIVNVEGNFTLKDAFWSAALARMEESEASRMLAADLANPGAWLARSGVEPTVERVAMARSHLVHQTAAAAQAMARSVVEITGSPKYLEDVRAVLRSGIPVHLVAGERSRRGWDVPQFVLERAASFTTVPDCGHLVTIEQPEAFGAIVRKLRNEALS